MHNAPYLPDIIVEMILMRSNAKDAVRFGAVCKDWKSAVERCRISIKNTPWLFVLAQAPPSGEGDARYLLLKASDSGATSMEIKITGIQETDLCIGAYNGWLALKNKDFQEAAQVRLSLLNPLSGARFDLPVVHARDVTQLHLSSAPVIAGCAAVAKGGSDCEFLLWEDGRREWGHMIVMTVPPAYAVSRRIVNLITFRRRLFGLDDVNGRLETTEIGQSEPLNIISYSNLPTPAAIAAPQYTSRSRHLVESLGGGELWYVMICRDEGFAVCGSFVFRFHPDNMTWSEVARLDGVALLLEGNCMVAVSAWETGCRENCIYIAGEPPAVAWRVYDRGDHSITNVCGTGVIPDNVSQVFWLIPS